MRVGTVSVVHVLMLALVLNPQAGSQAHHGQSVELLQARHCLQEQDNDSTTLHRLNRPREQVWRDRLVILQNEHTECLTENLSGILVVCVSDVGDGDEELERILIIRFPDSTLYITLDLGFSLLAVAGISYR